MRKFKTFLGILLIFTFILSNKSPKHHSHPFFSLKLLVYIAWIISFFDTYSLKVAGTQGMPAKDFHSVLLAFSPDEFAAMGQSLLDLYEQESPVDGSIINNNIAWIKY